MARAFVGITGASGSAYGVAVLRGMLDSGLDVDGCVSASGRRVLEWECGLVLNGGPTDAEALAGGAGPGSLTLFDPDDIGAPPASGTRLERGAVICPCSMGTLARIVAGPCDTLIARAAQVALKEQRRLVIVPREAPLSRIHLDWLSRAAWAGAVVVPAAPGFYHRPTSVQDLVDHLAAKVLDSMEVEHGLSKRWEGDAAP